MKNKITRGEFLKQLPILGAVLIGSGLFLQSCSKSKTDEDPCADLSKLTAEEKQTRDDFEYVSKSPNPDQLCDNCELWIAPAEGEICGGCDIMAGPIHPKGYCTAWVKISS
jgi:hypothetical protein